MSYQAIKKEEASINISDKLCTGCGICVDVCPQNVLEMAKDPSRVAGQIASVKDLDACTQCMICEIHCPDFAITVG